MSGFGFSYFLWNFPKPKGNDMLVPYEIAAEHLEVTIETLRSGKNKEFCKNGKFNMSAYQAKLKEREEREDYCFDALNFSDFIIEKIGKNKFFKSFPSKDNVNMRDAVAKSQISLRLATAVNDIFGQEFRALYENEDYDEVASHVPFKEREALTMSFVISEYWHNRKTTAQIAESLNVPESWINSEIRRLGLGKSKNGIKRKGRKGYVMSKEQRVKHQNQPHAKPVVQICPKTFKTVNEYSSTGAVERYGFSRENVRKAIKRAGISKGFLWARKGFEKPTIEHAKKKGNLGVKLQAAAYKKPTKKQLQKLYIDADMTLDECAKHFKCHRGTMAVLAMDYGLKKRHGKISVSTLKRLYVQKGVSVEQIAKDYGYTVSTVRTYLSKNGLVKKVVA